MFKKKILYFAVFMVLAGILNCSAIEPVFASHESDTACQTETDGHCCFVCHSIHHLWISAGDGGSLGSLSPQENFIKDRNALALDPPQRMIFHPPVVL